MILEKLIDLIFGEKDLSFEYAYNPNNMYDYPYTNEVYYDIK